MNAQTIQLANRFSALIREWLTADELAAVNKTNVAEPGYCATHECCDPNEAMMLAFVEVFGRDMDPMADERIYGAAWKAASDAGFQPINEETVVCAALFMAE